MRLMFFALLSALVVSQVGCRGYTTADPPFHLNPNMDTQERGEAYRESDFFADKMYMRMPIEGTVARGKLKSDEHLHFGMINGEHAKSLPKSLTIDEEFVNRGQQLYTRMCAACHGAIGNGDGLVGRRLMVKPPSFHIDRLYDMPPGHYVKVGRDGNATMPGYKQILTSEEDFWKIAVYIRILQESQNQDGEGIKRSALWWKQK